ncbi:MAG: hypothetical protein RMZ69_29730 [Nostoc sp. ChiQUE01a]|nr:hypothetical protein [Nostoc sp. ChiQUE01a]
MANTSLPETAPMASLLDATLSCTECTSTPFSTRGCANGFSTRRTRLRSGQVPDAKFFK